MYFQINFCRTPLLRTPNPGPKGVLNCKWPLLLCHAILSLLLKALIVKNKRLLFPFLFHMKRETSTSRVFAHFDRQVRLPFSPLPSPPPPVLSRFKHAVTFKDRSECKYGCDLLFFYVYVN